MLGFSLFLWVEFLLAIVCLIIPRLIVHNSFKVSLADNKRLLNIDFLRIFFTVGVVCFHFFRVFDIPNFGYQGVEFFFILSGFFLSLTFHNTLSVLDFVKKKIIAWIPLTIFGSILCGGYLSSFKYIFFLQSTGLGFIESVNAPAWFLGVLMWVSIFYFYMIKILSKPICNLAIAVITFCSFVLVTQNGQSSTFAVVLSGFPIRLFRGLAGVGAGYLLAQFCLGNNVQNNIQEKTTSYKLWTIVEFSALSWVVLRVFIVQIFDEWIFAPISSLLIIYLFVKKRGWLFQKLEHPVWGVLAQYCLPIYLTHWSLLKVFNEYSSIWMKSNRFMVLTIVLMSCIILGIFSYHFVQRPAEKWLKEHWK